jgi:hypothetical protein
MLTKKPQKNPNYFCEICVMRTNNKKDYERHLMTSKHAKLTKVNTELTEKTPNHIFNCETCNKKYTSRVGLWKHLKQCSLKNDDNVEDEMLYTKDKESLILQLLQQNGELQKSLIELSKEKTITNNNTNNSHNKTFNLNFFLNETCKNALNISDFVSSIRPTLEDLEYTGRQGYVAGISNIIIKKLNSLEEYIRPIHCCDQKREVLYIKDNDEWTKETEEKPILRKAIKLVANENIKNITEWRDAHPHCTESDSQKNNLYLKIVSNSMCGLDKEETNKNMNKIISNVVKEVTIEKNVI